MLSVNHYKYSFGIYLQLQYRQDFGQELLHDKCTNKININTSITSYVAKLLIEISNYI